jgi:hypothetical protein
MNAKTGGSVGEREQEKEKKSNNPSRPESREEKDKLKKDAEKMFIKELRVRVE